MSTLTNISLRNILIESVPKRRILCVRENADNYEGCSNMNASSFITFFTYMLRQNGKRFYKGLYFTFTLALGPKKNTVCLSSYSPLIEGHISILTNSML